MFLEVNWRLALRFLRTGAYTCKGPTFGKKKCRIFSTVSWEEPMDVTYPEGCSCQLRACAKAEISQNQAGGASLNVSESV